MQIKYAIFSADAELFTYVILIKHYDKISLLQLVVMSDLKITWTSPEIMQANGVLVSNRLSINFIGISPEVVKYFTYHS